MGRICTLEAPAALAEDARGLFPTLAGARHSRGPADVRVRRLPEGWEVAHRGVETCTTRGEALSSVEHAVASELLARDSDHCHVHAAGVVTAAGQALLAVGPSGAGKSSLALSWSLAGRPLLGDDVVAIDAQGRAHPFPRPLKVDAARLPGTGLEAEATVGWEPGTPEVWIDPTGGGGWAPTAVPVAVVAQVRFVPDAPTRVEAIPGGQCLRLLMDSLHETGVPASGSLDRLIRLVEGSIGLRVEHGDSRGIAAELLHRLPRNSLP